MKFVCSADLHLSIYSNDKIDPNTGLSEKLVNIINAMYNMANYAIENKIKNIVLAGDINHNKSIIHTIAQSILLDFVRKYSNDLYFIIIDGNHDMSGKSKNPVSSLKSLDNEKNVKMIHEPEKIENVLFVPWNPSTMNDYVKNNSSDYLISHFGLNEGQLSSGISIISDLKLSDLKNYRTVILGHYHKPQEIGNVWYCGSLVQLDWGEKHEDKRFLVVDTDNHDIQSIESKGYKKYYSFQVNNENKDEVINEGKKLQEEGHNVVFEKVENIDTSTFENEFKFVDKYEKDITNRGISTSMSKNDIVEEYMRINEIPEDKWNLYRDTALEIINEFEEKV